MFGNKVTEKLNPALDFLIVPMARSFDNISPDQNRWEREERKAYIQATKMLKTTTLMVNALENDGDSPSFGGALIVDVSGKLVVESTHGTDDMLFWDTS